VKWLRSLQAERAIVLELAALVALRDKERATGHPIRVAWYNGAIFALSWRSGERGAMGPSAIATLNSEQLEALRGR
jgi:hypothetical protein